MTGLGLSAVNEHDLRALVSALDRGNIPSPMSETSLQANALGHLVEPLRPYFGLGADGLLAVVDAVLAERRHRKSPVLSLVWTGDDPGVSHSRHTRVLLPELFERAREHVLIAGYSIDNGPELFEPLHRGMRDRGVTADLFVDVNQLEERLKQTARSSGRDWGLLSAPLGATRDAVSRGRAVVALFFQLMWTFGDPKPAVYFDPRTAEQWGGVSMHAKCVVIDHEYTLVTSANFTSRGQTRNVEAGVAIEDRQFAASLERQWLNLVDAGVVVRA